MCVYYSADLDELWFCIENFPSEHGVMRFRDSTLPFVKLQFVEFLQCFVGQCDLNQLNKFSTYIFIQMRSIILIHPGIAGYNPTSEHACYM